MKKLTASVFQIQCCEVHGFDCSLWNDIFCIVSVRLSVCVIDILFMDGVKEKVNWFIFLYRDDNRGYEVFVLAAFSLIF